MDAVTGESDTTNNCSASVEVTVQDAVTTPTTPQGNPDLMVTPASVSDNGPAASAEFTLSAMVRNAGDGASAAATLRYYRSADAAITAADAQVGTAPVTGLGAAGSAGASVKLTAPATPGTHYYGACVDAVTDETDTANNCSASVAVTVPEPKHPDLVVTSATVSDSSPATGARITLSATVENGGDGTAGATRLHYYRSVDATITRSDTEVGSAAVAELAASGSTGNSVALTAPSTPRTYYYGACVAAVTDESNTTNNCSASVRVVVEGSRRTLTWEVGTPTVDDTSPETGATFTLSATVSNTGARESVATTLRYYRSTDATIATTDTEVGTDSIAGLAAAGTSDQSIDLTAPDTAGTYYYGACVDAVADESDTANNCSGSVTVAVPVTVSEPEQSAPSVEISAEDDKGMGAGGRHRRSVGARPG